MKTRLLLLATAAAMIASAAGAEMYINAQIRLNIRDIFGGVDYVPSNNEVTEVADSVEDVIFIAESSNDEGTRIRAYRALAMFDDPSSKQTLVSAVQQYRGHEVGTDILFLRAALEALASRNADSTLFCELLAHPTADVRAEAARGLRRLSDQTALVFVRTQLANETDEWVKWELEKTIAALQP